MRERTIATDADLRECNSLNSLPAVPEAEVLTGTPDIPITQLCYDSREAEAGALFIALAGIAARWARLRRGCRGEWG